MQCNGLVQGHHGAALDKDISCFEAGPLMFHLLADYIASLDTPMPEPHVHATNARDASDENPAGSCAGGAATVQAICAALAQQLQAAVNVRACDVGTCMMGGCKLAAEQKAAAEDTIQALLQVRSPQLVAQLLLAIACTIVAPHACPASCCCAACTPSVKPHIDMNAAAR